MLAYREQERSEKMNVQVSMKRVIHLCTFFFGFTGVLSEVLKEVVRMKDIPLDKETKILNRTITCGDSNWGVFHTRTYTCNDIRVDGLRLAYGYYPGWGVDENCQETKGMQEFAQLCKLLLQRTDKHYKDFMGAMVNNATCDRTSDKRLMFEKKNRSRYAWRVMSPGNGWLSSLSCMVKS